MQDAPQPRAKRLLRKGVCIIAPILLIAATVYAKVIARRRWEGRAAVKGYGDVFKGQAIKESAKLKGATAEWVPFEARKHPDTPTKLWGNVKRPFPTGAWWTNLVVGGPSSSGDGLGTAFATPYTVSVLPDKGVVLGYGEVLATNDSLTLATSQAVWKSNFGRPTHLLDGVSQDLIVSLKGGLEKREVVAYDDLTMTMRCSAEKGQIDALFARGSPYVTFRVDGVPSLKSDALFTDLQAVDAVTNETMPKACAAYPSCILASMKGDCCPQPSGVKHPCCSGSLGAQMGEVFSVSLSNGQAWRLYFSTPVTLTWDSTGAHTTHSFEGVMRAAVVPSNATRDALMLDAHAEAYATAGSVRVTVDRAKDPDVGIVAFDWQVAYLGSSIPRDELEPALLMLALPHHVDALVADSSIGFLDILRYRGGLKGICRAVLGSSWILHEPLTSIGFTAPRPLKEQKHVDAIKKQVRSDVMRPAGETDKDAAWICFDDWFGNAYWNGKEAARLAGLALVAQEVGDDASFQSAIDQMRAILELWLEARNGDPLVYDATYGGLVTEKGLYDHDADFGNGYYNDHHFHYGYLLHAAAVAVKNDAGFAAKHRRALFALLYDVASPGSGHSLDSVSIDPRAFPRARHKDFYAGHSWASGIFFMGQGKAQESSSEAANAYYGAYLLALSLGDVALADWCRTLLAMEVRAARYYYHMPVGGEVYPARFADHNRMVGVLGALSTGAQTWFGPSPIYAHGIQILPVTPATEDLLKPPSFIAEDLAFLDVVLAHDAAVDDSWSSLVVCERAVLDPERAWKEMMALQTVDGGASKASLLYWIATRPAADAETKALLAKAEGGG